MASSWVLGPAGVKKGQTGPGTMAARAATWRDGHMAFRGEVAPESAPSMLREVVQRSLRLRPGLTHAAGPAGRLGCRETPSEPTVGSSLPGPDPGGRLGTLQ